MPEKQTLLDAVDDRAMIDLALKLVSIPSFKTEETAMARVLDGYFRERGYRTEMQEVEPGRFQTIATLPGTGGGKSLMFNGHMDIDPLAMGWRRDPWTSSVEGDRLYGAGSRNMKGGLVAMIAAAEAVRTSGARLKGDLVLACVVGELQGGVGTSYLCEHGPLTDMAVVPEPFGANNILTVNAGVLEMAVNVIGVSRHISRLEEGYIDAIEMMAKAVPVLKGVQFRHTPREDLPGLPRIIVGAIIGGRGRDHDLRGPNFISDFCTVLVDARFLPGMSSESVREDIEAALDKLKETEPDFQYEIEMPPDPKFKAFKMSMEPFDLPRDEYILESVLAQYRTVTGREPDNVGALPPGSYSGDDTSHLWRAGVPCLLYGPWGSHESATVQDEYTRIDDMSQVARVLALTALDICSLPA
jgi:acetylornithine deacetylase